MHALLPGHFSWRWDLSIYALLCGPLSWAYALSMHALLRCPLTGILDLRHLAHHTPRSHLFGYLTQTTHNLGHFRDMVWS